MIKRQNILYKFEKKMYLLYLLRSEGGNNSYDVDFGKEKKKKRSLSQSSVSLHRGKAQSKANSIKGCHDLEKWWETGIREIILRWCVTSNDKKIYQILSFFP